MKKLAIASGLAVIIAGGATATPFYVGNKAEKLISEAQTYERGQLTLAYDGESYERGYLSSRANAKLSWRIEDEVVEMAVAHEIEHVFVPRVVSRFKILPGGGELQQALHSIFGTDAFLLAETRLTTGGSQTEVSMPAVEKTLPDGETQLHFAGMSGAFSIDDAAFSGNFALRPIQLSAEGRSLHISEQQLAIELSAIHDLITPGSAVYTLQKIELRDSEGDIALNDLRITSSQTITGELVDGDALMELASLETPQGAIESIRFRVAVNDLHRELVEFAIELEESPAGFDPAAVAPEAYRPKVARFLESGPSVRMDFLVGAEADSDMALGWVLAYHQPAGIQIDLNRPLELIAGVEANASLRFKPEFLDLLTTFSAGSLGAAENLRVAMMNLEGEGYLIHDKSGYHAKLGFKGGDFFVNDNPSPELGLMLLMLLAQ